MLLSRRGIIMSKDVIELGEIYVTPKGSLCRFEYFEDEIEKEEFTDRVMHKHDFFDDDQIFIIDVNCVFVSEHIENHPLFPMIVWDEEDIMFGFNPRFISKRFGW